MKEFLTKLKTVLVKRWRIVVAGAILLLLSYGLQSFAVINFQQGELKACNRLTQLMTNPQIMISCEYQDGKLVLNSPLYPVVLDVYTGEEIPK